jgi:hypothetical protein
VINEERKHCSNRRLCASDNHGPKTAESSTRTYIVANIIIEKCSMR